MYVHVIGTGWACNNGRTALGSDFGAVDKFAENLSRLIESPDLRLKLRDNALKELPKYSINHIMAQWNGLFKECLN